jgi:hypothetical protein
MVKSLTKLGIVATVLLALWSSSQAQTVSGSIGDGTVRRGGSAKGTIVLTIPSDLHVNSNTPDSKYAIPTSVRLTTTGVRVSAVTYPKGKTKKFSFSETPINVYEGKVEFGFNVSVPASFKGDSIEIKANVRYQACNDEVCFPPRTREVVMTARVR